MTDAEFSVPITDLDRGDVSRTWRITPEWLSGALEGSEAEPKGPEGQLRLNLVKQGREIIVTGRARAAVVMPCARTLDPVDIDLKADIYLLLQPKASPEPPGRKERQAAARAKKRKEEAPLSEEEAAEDTYSGENVVLDDFVREHLLLELPLFPLRSDLRSTDSSGIGPPSQPVEQDEKAADPRLAPLAAIAEKLRASQPKGEED